MVPRSGWYPTRVILRTMRLELTRRGDYGVRAMLALARAEAAVGDRQATAAPEAPAAPGAEGPWLSVARIAAEMAIPERFLPQVMRVLARGGLVQARTGRTGGYRLARPAAAITLLDVIDVVEPADADRRCVLRGVPCSVDGRCAVHDAFDGARVALRGQLARATLAELAARP